MLTMDIIPKWQRARPTVRSPGQIRLRNTITVTEVKTGQKPGRYFTPASITIILLHQMKQELILPHPAIAAAEVHHHQAAAVRAQ